MKKTKKVPALVFKPMTGTTAASTCLYCRKPIGDATAVSMTARDGGPRIGVAHTDCVALAAGLNPAAAKQETPEV
jgi:hypothetical protein